MLVYQICSFTKPKSPFSKPLFFLQYLPAKIKVNSNCWRPVVLLDRTGWTVRPPFAKAELWCRWTNEIQNQISDRISIIEINLSQNNETTKVQVDSTTITLDKGLCGYYLVRIVSAHLIVATKNWSIGTLIFPTWHILCFFGGHKIARKFHENSRRSPETDIFLKLIVHLSYRMATWSNSCAKGALAAFRWSLTPI